jgi:uncharacterized membrane protein YgcG
MGSTRMRTCATKPSVRTLPLALVLLTAALPAAAHAALEPASILSPRDGAEMAIVTVPTTAGAEHRDFATRLFNHWRIGHAVRNNGVLIFVAVQDRAAEIILGNGIDSDAHVAMSDRIMRDIMVPRFRHGDNAGAVLAGARACARDFFQVGPPDASVTAVERTADRAEPAELPVWRVRAESGSPPGSACARGCGGGHAAALGAR